jgi:hypothetical protein
VTGSPTSFAGRPAGTRAIELTDSATDSYFLKVFGRPERLLTCECERSNDPSMSQVLHIANGDTLNSKIEAPNNHIASMLDRGADDREVIDDLYLSAVSRLPTANERRSLVAILAEQPRAGATPASLKATAQRAGKGARATDGRLATRRRGIEDLYWSVLSSKEFLFNH